MRDKPVLNRRDNSVLIPVISPRQLEDLGDAQQTRENLLFRLCSNPEDRIVFQSVSVGILQGDLCFADTAQALQGRGLGEGNRLIAVQLCVQCLQNFLAPSEVGIA